MAKQYNATDKRKADSLQTAMTAVSALKEIKAMRICLFDVCENAPFTDYYVICTGRSVTHMHAIAEHVADEMKKIGIQAAPPEGRNGDTWLLVDLGDVIVHIFSREAREFYNLERLLPRDREIPIPADEQPGVTEKQV